jgi:Cu/Ag efflux protein CusF
MKTRLFIPLLLILLAAPPDVHAQFGGGGGGYGGGGGHGGGGRHGRRSQEAPPDSSAPAYPSSTRKKEPEVPPNKVQITGVVQAIDPSSGRITIAYDEVDALNWPAGAMPFAVARTDLLKQASVGEKIRFTIDSQEISSITPYTPRQGD